MTLSLVTKDLTKLDYAFFDPKYGPSGDSLIVDAELFGTQDLDGFIFDFSYAKKAIKSVIDEVVDHKFVIAKDFVQTDSNGYISFQTGHYFYRAPKEAFCVIPSRVNIRTIEHFIEQALKTKMPQNVESVKIKLRRENNPEANYYFRYTHGLKNHYGNCQRLFHGHRSTVMIWADGERDIGLERFLIHEVLKNTVHFVFWDNVVNKHDYSNFLKNGRVSETNPVILKYKASQGDFEAHLPSEVCYFLNKETSIENLASHFVELLKIQNNGAKHISLFLCEGIDKGSIKQV